MENIKTEFVQNDSGLSLIFQLPNFEQRELTTFETQIIKEGEATVQPSTLNSAPIVEEAAINAIKYCNNCGAVLPSEAVFCSECGIRLKEIAPK